MLKLFRQKKLGVKVLLFAIVFMVGGAMLVYLVPGAGGDASLSDPQGILAQVGKMPLTQIDVQRQYQRTAERLGTQSAQFREVILEQLVQEMILQQVVVYEAERLGIEVTPEEVAARLRRIPGLYPGGKFVGRESYQRVVEQQFRMSVPEFEETLRRQTLLAKLYQWVTGGLTVAAPEVEQEYRRRNEQVQIEYALFRPDQFARGLQPNEEELQAYFESRRERYRLPARRAVRFVPVDYLTLGRRIQVSQQELEEHYQRHRQAYHVPERVLARHIMFLLPRPGLLESGPVEPAKTAAEVREKAKQVLAQLRQGKDFAELARQYSEHADSREQGGEIGWVRRGQTVPALEQALFSLPPGGPAELVETGYGLHIVQVRAHEQERVKPLAEVRNEIEPVLKEEKIRQAALQEARKIVAAVRAGKTLAEAAQEAGWPVEETPLFRRDEPLGPFGESLDFQEAAFRLPAESAGQPGAPVSEPVPVPPGYAVLQLKEDSPARPARLEEVREPVLQAYRQERGAEQAREAAHRLAAEAEEAGSLRGPARRLGAAVERSEKFARNGFLPGLGSARDLAPVAFSLPAGGLSPALPVGGNWVVLRVLARQEVDLGRLTEEERKAIRNALLDQKRGLAWTVFQESLKKRMLADGTLKLNQAAINRITGQS